MVVSEDLTVVVAHAAQPMQRTMTQTRPDAGSTSDADAVGGGRGAAVVLGSALGSHIDGRDVRRLETFRPTGSSAALHDGCMPVIGIALPPTRRPSVGQINRISFDLTSRTNQLQPEFGCAWPVAR